MTLVIAAATQNEMKAVLKGFNGRGRVGCQLPSQGEWCESPANGHQCLLAVIGVGPINAALNIGRILGARDTIEGVISVGIAGSFDLGAAPIGSTVLASKEIWPEFGLRKPEGVDAQGIAFAQLRACDEDGNDAGDEQAVWNSIELSPLTSIKALDLNMPENMITGASLTVAGVTATTENAASMKAQYQVLTENMEGFALALACKQAGIPFLEMRTISNPVGSRAKEDWHIDKAFEALGTSARSLFI